MKKLFSASIFAGAIWGLFEATAGYVLHMVPGGGAAGGWLVWYPAAAFFMLWAYRLTGSRASAILAAAVAAAVKLADLGLPGTIDRVVNPAVSILLEGCAMAVFLRAVAAEPGPADFSGRARAVLGASFAWRAAYLAYIAVMPAWMVSISPLRDMGALAAFLLAQPAVNAAVAIAASGLWSVSRAGGFAPGRTRAGWIAAGAMLAAAVAATRAL